MLQSRVSACNGLQRSLQSLQKYNESSTVSVEWCNFHCKLQLGIATCNMSSATYNGFFFPTL